MDVNQNENAKKLILELIRKEEEEEEENKNDRIEFFQEAFNVLMFSFNRQGNLSAEKKSSFSQKNLTFPDFCKSTLSMKEYFRKNPTIYDLLLEDMKKETLVSYSVLYGDKCVNVNVL